jgi:hypothetical protein
MIGTESEVANEKLKQENEKLRKENEKLKKENEELTNIVDKYLDEMALDILHYFSCCRSIRETATAYSLTPERLVELIPYWDDCTDGLQSAQDYKIYVRDDEDEDEEEVIEVNEN